MYGIVMRLAKVWVVRAAWAPSAPHARLPAHFKSSHGRVAATVFAAEASRRIANLIAACAGCGKAGEILVWCLCQAASCNMKLVPASQHLKCSALAMQEVVVRLTLTPGVACAGPISTPNASLTMDFPAIAGRCWAIILAAQACQFVDDAVAAIFPRREARHFLLRWRCERSCSKSFFCAQFPCDGVALVACRVDGVCHWLVPDPTLHPLCVVLDSLAEIAKRLASFKSLGSPCLVSPALAEPRNSWLEACVCLGLATASPVFAAVQGNESSQVLPARAAGYHHHRQSGDVDALPRKALADVIDSFSHLCVHLAACFSLQEAVGRTQERLVFLALLSSTPHAGLAVNCPAVSHVPRMPVTATDARVLIPNGATAMPVPQQTPPIA
mmetsp:Transcript_35917/g.64915  ORF Transcript_35917/g.64915 Transcript_35917/m.64915 type:complete len:385 (+) Transcript_35917:558-1712(+)